MPAVTNPNCFNVRQSSLGPGGNVFNDYGPFLGLGSNYGNRVLLGTYDTDQYGNPVDQTFDPKGYWNGPIWNKQTGVAYASPAAQAAQALGWLSIPRVREPLVNSQQFTLQGANYMVPTSNFPINPPLYSQPIQGYQPQIQTATSTIGPDPAMMNPGMGPNPGMGSMMNPGMAANPAMMNSPMGPNPGMPANPGMSANPRPNLMPSNMPMYPPAPPYTAGVSGMPPTPVNPASSMAVAPSVTTSTAAIQGYVPMTQVPGVPNPSNYGGIITYP